jgi:hypothetical protein
MAFRVPEENRITAGSPASDSSCGCNGAFLIEVRGEKMYAIASDELGWEHVSVSFVKGDSRRTPSWRQMCGVKDIFWEPEDIAMQVHPPASDYVNEYPGCLHLWRPTQLSERWPPSAFVGRKRMERS